MSSIHSFPPIASTDAQVLILGSMPGRESLRVAQYYAHPRNAFWPIIGELLGFDPAQPYPMRCRQLVEADIALWDVLASCRRSSSLDADIDAASVAANDFGAFFRSHPHIRRVYFNGAMAEQSFRKHVLPGLADPTLQYQRLPSTSPAHAALSYPQKLAAWRVVVAGMPCSSAVAR
ncbi:MAG: DNA-deoxyinosine glycosylase [Gallionella sp.]|nr:DNA-deoxyinosine glycosylase [Gallionella sp.]MDD4946494.1 DNA-deoxyinosine glycosylase [Gallionella sp.]MDD5612945.1 DNA-deoxyinosine glycosylase [Gallionella sp.]